MAQPPPWFLLTLVFNAPSLNAAAGEAPASCTFTGSKCLAAAPCDERPNQGGFEAAPAGLAEPQPGWRGRCDGLWRLQRRKPAAEQLVWIALRFAIGGRIRRDSWTPAAQQQS